jgi:glycosyltransferase involved in cell wall biosynthesis
LIITVDLSVVIPVYNEGRKIDKDIRMAAQFMEINNISGEIIISDDGSKDDTLDIPQNVLSKATVPVRIIDNKKHYGKGNAVRSGMLQAQGKIILFIDSGACVYYEDILPGIDLLKSDSFKIVHGSRFMPGSFITRKKQWYRQILSYTFRKFIHSWVDIPYDLTDTQCGLKIYEKEVGKELYGQCITRGFMFDIEIILRAEKAGYAIKEFPITWAADPDSRLFLSRTFFNMISELRKIKRIL